MPGLARTDDRTFVHAMQEMNVAIVNPVFLLSFLGAPAASLRGDRGERPLRPALGDRRSGPRAGHRRDHGVGNIPLNNALDAAGPVDRITELGAVRADVREPVGAAEHRAAR